MPITLKDWIAAAGATQENAEKWHEHIEKAMERYRIDSLKRIAAFLAQIAHESGGFRYVREIWGPTETQQKYEGRIDLGNIQPGDGYKFRGRGLIQITGRSNYAKMSMKLNVDCIANPAVLEEPHYAAMSAGLYWSERRLSELADADDFKGITKKINGGLNGYDDRVKRWESVKELMGIA